VAPSVRWDLLVAGHTNVDRFLHVTRLPEPDRTVPLRDSEARLGGTAANIARAAARRGLSVALHSRVGDDFPPEFEETLRQSRVDLDAFGRVAGARSPTCYIVVDHAGRQFTLIDQGPMAERSDAVPRVPKEMLAKTGWLHLATGPPTYQLRLQAEARRAGVRVAADPAQEIHYLWRPRPLRTLLENSEVFFGNEAEVRLAAEKLGWGSVRGLLEIVPLVIATLGPRGVRAYTRRGIERVPIPGRAPTRHFVGAGDNFRGGFYGAWFGGEPLAECLRAGLRAAAEWIRTRGGSDREAARPSAG
jgi:sugar/nucleoside kinase (ribokinase family)